MSTHEMPVVTFAPYSKDCQWHLSLNSDNQKCLQTLPHVPWTRNPQLRTTEPLGMFQLQTNQHLLDQRVWDDWGLNRAICESEMKS